MIIKKKIVQPMGLIRPMWVGLDLCNRLGLFEFFFTHHDRLGQKILLTRLMHIPTHFHRGGTHLWSQVELN